MGAKAKRIALATALQAGLPSGWVAYPAPPDNLVAQSAVISPRNPYLTDVTMGLSEVHLQLTLLVNLAAGPTALDILDDAIDAIKDDVLSAGDVQWEGVQAIGTAEEVGGVDYLAASINLTIL